MLRITSDRKRRILNRIVIGDVANSKSQTPDLGKAGSCVSCSRSDSYDNLVQCDQCDEWRHMRCAGVTESIADQSWVCRGCVPHSVISSSSSKSARIGLRIQQLEEERAIQQRELEAERKALEQERKAIQEKYRLLEEQLSNTRDDVSSGSRVSRQLSMGRVRNEQMKEGAAAEAVDEDELHHQDDTNRSVMNGKNNFNVQQIHQSNQQSTIMEKFDMQRNQSDHPGDRR
ncbi:uncharacterized protein LOC129732209 [Wyeomyia smithii]|uniref:uncharacterized protein LOC129732209 n=1 Tax=Wyeomyia smithii TaxID=174621 RepID=UPI002467D83E|nr:uncharacterized protein LOC129732209 [Wyeomyia smithii]XP_055548829.1 uncharacterized protein LOC129732209 [Wyeomyia smithii]